MPGQESKESPRRKHSSNGSRSPSSPFSNASASGSPRHSWIFTQPAGQHLGSELAQDTTNANQARRANIYIAENTLNDFSDLELQEILFRRYHQLDQRGRPTMDEVRNRVATLLGLLGPRGLAARDAVILLAQAGWDTTFALRQYIKNVRPQIQQEIERVQNPPQEDLKDKEKDFLDDGDDEQPVPAGIQIIEIDHPDLPDRKANAVFHHEIRRYLIEHDQRRYGNYRYPRKKGKEFEDQTAPHPDQLRWGFDKQTRMPEILFQYKKAGHLDQDYEWGYMWWRRHVVVDIDQSPLRDFLHIPSTLASNVEGGLLEALERLDGRVRHQELSSRVFSRKVQQPTKLRLKARDNKLSQQMRRFRERQGAITWNDSRGGDSFQRWMEENLPPHLKAQNTTRGFPQLSPVQVQEIKALQIGKFPQRSKTRNPVARDKYLADHKLKLERLRELAAKHLEQRLAESESESELESEEGHKGPDSRFDAPKNEEEVAELHDAMLPTIQQFLDLTGELPAIGHWRLSYMIILGEIHRQLQIALKRQGASPVELVGLGYWTGGILNVRAAMLEASPLAKKAAEIEREEEKEARRVAAARGEEQQEDEEDEDVEIDEDDETADGQDGSEDDEDSYDDDEAVLGETSEDPLS
ncbi:MAG: hypothetical protein Q9178_006739 [Gyalolechia marmorata]